MTMILLGCIGFGIEPSGPVLPAETLRPYLESYTANRLAFPFWTFRFEMSTSLAADAAAFERGEMDVLATARGFFASDGQNMRYELVHPIEDHEKLTSSESPSEQMSVITSYRALTDGTRVLEDRLFLDRSKRKFDHLVGIYSDLSRFYFFFMFPFELGRAGVSADKFSKEFDRLSKGQSQLVEYDPTATLGGRKVVRFVLATKNWTRTYWIDPERASIPMKVEDRDENAKIRKCFIYDDIQFVPKAGWLPRRMATYQAPRLVRSVRITEIRLDLPPSASEFRLAFDQPTRLMDGIRGFAYKPKKEWGLLNLPRPEPGNARKVNIVKFEPKSMTVNARGIPVPAPDPSALPGELEPWPTWVVYLVLAMTGITIGGAALYRRRKQRPHAA